MLDLCEVFLISTDGPSFRVEEGVLIVEVIGVGGCMVLFKCHSLQATPIG